MIEDFITSAVFWMCVIGFHEVGHLIAFHLFGRRDVAIRLNFFAGGVETGTAKDVLALNPHQLYTVDLAGIVLGYLPFLFVKTPASNVIIYCFICVADLLQMLFMLTKFDFRTWRWKTDELLINLEFKRLCGIRKELDKEMN